MDKHFDVIKGELIEEEKEEEDTEEAEPYQQEQLSLNNEGPTYSRGDLKRMTIIEEQTGAFDGY